MNHCDERMKSAWKSALPFSFVCDITAVQTLGLPVPVVRQRASGGSLLQLFHRGVFSLQDRQFGCAARGAPFCFSIADRVPYWHHSRPFRRPATHVHTHQATALIQRHSVRINGHIMTWVQLHEDANSIASYELWPVTYYTLPEVEMVPSICPRA
jgi:hypothetical protein